MSRVSKFVLRIRTTVSRSNAVPPRRRMTALFVEVVNYALSVSYGRSAHRGDGTAQRIEGARKLTLIGTR
jgi:hypothetical protein